ncbi:sensor histidine kinase [Paenibacillus pasadenensis]|uniref:cache domain-containing sensor histidine kinase n=1 Tax=Paenibacillus pasadenensis TaxID=217090 RepID=UPI00203CA048|nr:sensor histidine kinase [Paenibacillus pasadenensis]MCM3748085.1 sensor histidine kinase [Paenibacillus pasadenensis]
MIGRTMEKLRKQGLFLKLFLVTLISIIAVSLLTLFITIRMSEQLFLQTFSITNGKLLNQMKSNLESYNNAIATGATLLSQNAASRSYLSSGETGAVALAMRTYQMTEGMKSIQSNFGAYDASIMIVGANGRSYSTDPWYWPVSAEELKNHPITKATEAHPAQILYQLYRGGKHEANSKEPMLVASKALFDQSTGKIYGTLYVAIRDRDFKPLYANFTSEGNDVVLLNKEGVIVSSNRSELIGSPDEQLLQEVESEQEGKEKYVAGNERIVLSEYLPEFGFYLVNMIDKKAVTGQMVNVKAVTLTIMAIVAISLVIVFLITRRMTQSLRMLVGQMSSIPTGGLNHHVDVANSSYEVKELGSAFNFMLDSLHDYINRLVETQKQQRNAELAALQMQINPHFLYNTLASIKFLVQQGNKEKAAGTINALISLLQNTVSDLHSTIPVRQELETLKHYVYINHVRYGDKIRVHYFVEPDSLDYHLPKLILQPFIENAFFHAFNQKEEGSILIMIAVQEDQLVCEVADDGDGIELERAISEEEQLPAPMNKRHLFSGIGIRNVDDRIKLMYGEEYGISITSKRNEGTKIIVTLPLTGSKDRKKT